MATPSSDQPFPVYILLQPVADSTATTITINTPSITTATTTTHYHHLDWPTVPSGLDRSPFYGLWPRSNRTDRGLRKFLKQNRVRSGKTPTTTTTAATSTESMYFIKINYSVSMDDEEKLTSHYRNVRKAKDSLLSAAPNTRRTRDYSCCSS